MAVYATLAQFRSRLSGDIAVATGIWDQVIVDSLGEASNLIDEEVRNARGQQPGWSFLAAQPYGVQLVSLSPAGTATSGTFTLTSGASTTVAIVYGASAAVVQAALDTILGAGHSLVTGAPGGPWTVTFEGALSGPQPTLVPASTLTPSTVHAIVEDLVDGSAASVTRRYSGNGSSLILIDDCVAVSAVNILNAQGQVLQPLTAGTDYLTVPLQGLPITSLELTYGWWPPRFGGVQVTMQPGYGLAIPTNVTLAALQEAVRNLRSAQAGEDDRLGVTPYGSVVVSKALLSSTLRLLGRYLYGAGFLRRPG